MKIIITESQYNTLLSKLPRTLLRRLTDDDLAWLDENLYKKVDYAGVGTDFDYFIDDVVGMTLQEFVSERKGDEIQTYVDPTHGLMYDEDSFDEVADRYWGLFSILTDYYRDELYKIWEKEIKR